MKIPLLDRLKFYLTPFLAFIAVLSITANVYLINKSIPHATSQNSPAVQFKVTKVIDGDTFDLENGERVRIYEVNAPEYPKDCMGVDAKSRLEDLILEKSVGLERTGKDNFGRTLAYVYQNRLLINEVLVEEGLAYFSKAKGDTQYSLEIEKAQQKAQLAARGVWSSLCLTKKEGCVIKGNYRSADNTRIYHTPDCYNYDRITIKNGTSDRWFCTEEEAAKAGFTKSKDCPR